MISLEEMKEADPNRIVDYCIWLLKQYRDLREVCVRFLAERGLIHR